MVGKYQDKENLIKFNKITLKVSFESARGNL